MFAKFGWFNNKKGVPRNIIKANQQFNEQLERQQKMDDLPLEMNNPQPPPTPMPFSMLKPPGTEL